MNRKTLLVDCDGTVCDGILNKWVLWLQEQTGVEKDISKLSGYGIINYDLASYWKEELTEEGIDPFNFWRRKDIYEDVLPCPWSQDVLYYMWDAGWDIVFVTHIKGSHFHSKHRFLKQHFPWLTGVVATKEKFLVRGDALIDDRNEHLASMLEGVKCIQRITPFSQSVELTKEHLKYNWTMGANILYEYLERKD